MKYDHAVYLMQIGLRKEGHYDGALDGLEGPKTRSALNASRAARFGSITEGKKADGTRPPRPKPTTASKTAVFGPPGVKGGSSPKKAYFAPPYPMVFSWGGKVKRIGCHAMIAEPLKAALEEIGKKGKEWIENHGLNIYAGCYSPRRARGGRALSDHAWAIAIDLNPDANGLKTTWRPGEKGKNGTLQMPYEAVDIFQDHGFQVGFATGNGNRRDMMHVAYVDRS
jgi:hypothetical protein